MNCVFCSIVKGELPSKKLYESEHVVAFEDINKVAPVHVLVVPKKHMTSIMDLPATDTELLAAIQEGILQVAKHTGVDESGFRVITNRGSSAGQTVFHLHYHVIGGRDLAVTLG